MQASDLEQLMLELINDARLNPMGNAARYLTGYAPLASTDPLIQQALTQFGVNGAALQSAFSALVATHPLAWNDNLGTAAENHSQAQITAQEQSHLVAGELALGARLTAAGYTGWTTAGENVYAYGLSVMYGHAGFMVDWGTAANGMQDPAKHRLSIMNTNYTEIGIDVSAESTTANPLGPYVITQDLANRGKIFLLGVAYNDSDNNDFYSIGEGRSGLVVSGGLSLVFNNGTFHLGTDDGGSSFQLTGTSGVQEIGGTAAPVGTVTPGSTGGTGGTSTDPNSLDVGTPTVARTIDASTGNITFTDNVEATSNVRITGMTAGDKIAVTNAIATDYNFTRDFQDTNDLVITYTDTGTGATNRIVLDEVLPTTGAVGSLALATATVGFTFMTFA